MPPKRTRWGPTLAKMLSDDVEACLVTAVAVEETLL